MRIAAALIVTAALVVAVLELVLVMLRLDRRPNKKGRHWE